MTYNVNPVNIDSVSKSWWFPEISVPFGSIGTAISSVTTLTLAGNPLFLSITNNTNNAVQVSFDGVNVGITIAAGQTFQHSFVPNRRTGSREVWLLAPVAPTSGSVLFSGYY